MEKRIYMYNFRYVSLNHFAEQQKLTHHCKSTIIKCLNIKNRKKEIKLLLQIKIPDTESPICHQNIRADRRIE